ncbi:Beta-N-acetylglucosaminidase [Clostridium cavendishii DSM 21758]|uniref:Beta-N-acetylglucosaminidase n=1 Tax=Clostridium cavendishii DSM 21758 TaxID=1121302 RepID=A0A1M6PH26_9CLOT|nr:triple tyrosine motif-containing protein [Clostridium cavendishii]SHK07224.1 Beta-N-acetylglucosaminidase [Clostridium cavendishii DSM 21758]
MNLRKKVNLFILILIITFFIKGIEVFALSVNINSLNVSKQSAKVGETVNISAIGSGSKNLLYKFSIYDGATWYVLQDYSSRSTTTWKPYRASTSKIKVEIKDRYSPGNYSYKQLDYEVYSNVKASSITTSLNTPQLVNKDIKFTTNTNLTKGVLYKYSVFDGQAWMVVRDYTYDKSYTWKPTKAGDYKIKVDIKEANSKRYPDTSIQTSFQIANPPQIQQLSSNVVSPRKIGNTIVFNTKAIYGTSTLYRYWINDGTQWSMSRDYSIDANYTWIPSKEGNYKIKVDVKDKNSLNQVDSSKEMSFQVLKYGVITYINTNLTLDVFLNSQMNLNSPAQAWSSGDWINASKDQVQYYLNPNNFITDYGINQFLKLNYMDGITVQDLNTVLIGKGVLQGKGQAFLDAGKLYNINPVYLLAHSLLETGNGTSTLATGITLSSIHETFGDINSKIVPLSNPTKVYNVYGYGAYDSNPNLWGSEKAYREGWFSVEQAIIGGAKYISKNYINNSTYNQNTLYKMRWDLTTLSKNPTTPYAHQYATDIGWAYKQSQTIKNIISKMNNSMFYYEVPKFIQ